MRKNLRFLAVLIVFSAALAGCKKEGAVENAAPADPFEAGRKLYTTYCLACHNKDPKLDGNIGPANYGASLDLLSAKVLRGKYPEGYTPKRKTSMMNTFPQFTEAQIQALHAYLNSEQ